MHMLLSDIHGTDIPRRFVITYAPTAWGIKPEDVDVLLAGEGHPDYWETWEDVCRYAKHTDKGGVEWRLWQDGDLFAFNPDEDGE